MLSQNKDLLIEANGISVAYSRNSVALEDVSLKIFKGDFIAITGPNGGGKSTLLKVLLRLLPPTKGSVGYFKDGEPSENLKVGYLPQKSNIDSRFPITVEEVVSSGLYGIGRNWFGRFSGEVREKVDSTLELMGIAGLRDRVIGTLSGGQLQRTLLGRAIISEPEIVVLDEPLSYVDHEFVNQIYKIVEDISKRATVVLVSHEMTVISEMANRHWIVDHSLHECHSHHHYLKSCE